MQATPASMLGTGVQNGSAVAPPGARRRRAIKCGAGRGQWSPNARADLDDQALALGGINWHGCVLRVQQLCFAVDLEGLQRAGLTSCSWVSPCSPDLLIGLLSSTRSIEGVVIQPTIGALSDRVWTRFGRRRPFLIIGITLSALFFVAGAFVIARLSQRGRLSRLATGVELPDAAGRVRAFGCAAGVHRSRGGRIRQAVHASGDARRAGDPLGAASLAHPGPPGTPREHAEEESTAERARTAGRSRSFDKVSRLNVTDVDLVGVSAVGRVLEAAAELLAGRVPTPTS